MMGWNGMRRFQPNSGDYVIIHCFGWADWYFEPAVYERSTKLFRRMSNGGVIDEDMVDYWMAIPKIPEE